MTFDDCMQSCLLSTNDRSSAWHKFEDPLRSKETRPPLLVHINQSSKSNEMKLLFILLSALISLGCVTTAFVPPSFPKLALVPRRSPALTSADDPLLINGWNRRGLSPLYSIFDEINKLNEGGEGDAMSEEDLLLVRDVLRKIVSDETKAEDLANATFFEIEQEAIQTLPQQQEVTAQASGYSSSTVAPAKASSTSTLIRPEFSVYQSPIIKQMKAVFRKLLDFVELVIKARSKDNKVLAYTTYGAHNEVQSHQILCKKYRCN
jgi:hypothetical protein